MRAEDFALELQELYARPMLKRYDDSVEDGLNFSDATKCMTMVLSYIRIAMALNVRGPFTKALSDIQQLEMDMTAEILKMPHIQDMRTANEREDR